VLPQRPEILLTQLAPAAVVHDETGVEAVHARSSDDLTGASRRERPHDRGHVGGLQDGEVLRDRRPADLAGSGEPRRFEHAAAVHQDQLGETPERTVLLHGEQLLDVLGPEGVHPFQEGARRLRREEVLRKSARTKAVLDVRIAERRALAHEKRPQVQFVLASRQRVTKLARCRDTRRAAGNDADIAKVVSRVLEHLGRLVQAMHLVQHDPLAPQTLQEPHWITQHRPDARIVAVEVLHVVEGLREARLADAANARQPNDRARPPKGFHALQPVVATNHMQP